MSASFTIAVPDLAELPLAELSLVDSLPAEAGREGRLKQQTARSEHPTTEPAPTEPASAESTTAEPATAGRRAAADGRAVAGWSPPGDFAELLAGVWRRESGRLAALAAGMGLARDAAADVLQEVYLRALASPPPLARASERVEDGLQAVADHASGAASDEASGDCRSEQLVRWLFRVTANACRLAHRQSGRRQRLWSAFAAEKRAAESPAASDGSESTAAGVESVQFAELRREVDAALARLDEHDRLLVVLRYFLNWNSRQIAELLEQPESTIRGRLRACRLRLASELGEWNAGGARAGG